MDQMHLLAMADTVASCKIDLAERFAIDAARNAMDKVSTTSCLSLEFGSRIKRILLLTCFLYLFSMKVGKK